MPPSDADTKKINIGFRIVPQLESEKHFNIHSRNVSYDPVKDLEKVLPH